MGRKIENKGVICARCGKVIKGTIYTYSGVFMHKDCARKSFIKYLEG